MRRTNATVRRHVLAAIVHAPGAGPCVVRGYRATIFRYDSRDPWAVMLDIAQGSGWVTWRFARSLLADGLNTRTGEGAVTVWPERDSADGVLVRLAPPAGTVTLRFARADIEHALARTEALVPEGSEHTAVDWDHEWARFGKAA